MASTTSNFVGLVDSGFHTTTDGCKIYYELHGKGEQKVVLIQGTACKSVCNAIIPIIKVLLFLLSSKMSILLA